MQGYSDVLMVSELSELLLSRFQYKDTIRYVFFTEKHG
jgi:hypothetical protein